MECLRSSPLTLTRVLKTLVQGEKVERARKKKRSTIELPREATPAVEEEQEIEEMWGGGGGVEDYPEQPVLSLRAEEIVHAHNREKKGKKRAEEQESNNSELFSLLIEMRLEM